ncbi:MAG: copper homeostasis protein CutC [Bacteroidales bacterium]|nr:copper homeostasis protein CutC [Bacteroidales bacterium]
MSKILIEACVTSAQSALNAEKGGALRVELCDNLIEGGTTPGAGTIAILRERLTIGLFIMIRPRGGDFCYSDLEFEIMKEDVKIARLLGADGVVAGILLPDGNIDVKRMGVLKELAGDMGFTCHRAFDMSIDKFKALEDLIDLGVDRILTSGGKNKAPEGTGLISDLIEKAAGRITIMPGSGVNEDTIINVKKETGATEFHVTGFSLFPGNMIFRNPEVSMGDNVTVPEYDQWLTDPNRIRMIVELANS